MRHFDAWLLRDPYSIWHYYSTGRRWQETVRDLIQERKICAPQVDDSNDDDDEVLAVPSTFPVPVICAAAGVAPSPTQRAIVPLLSAAVPVTSTLSLPSGIEKATSTSQQWWSPQRESLFLQKLPTEIRLQIYEYVFGDGAVHLVQVRGKIRHVRCHRPSTWIERHRRCCPVALARWSTAAAAQQSQSPPEHGKLYPHTHPDLLDDALSNSSVALLRSCRAIYAEAAEILYRQAEFDVDDLHTFIAFSMSIAPAQRRAIKRLCLQWMPVWQPMSGEEHCASIYSHTHNDRLWTQFWARVAALQGLERLRLSLDLGQFTGNLLLLAGRSGSNTHKAGRLRLGTSEAWIKPLLQVRGLCSFEMAVTAKCDALARALLEDELCRDAAALRDYLCGVLCSSPWHGPCASCASGTSGTSGASGAPFSCSFCPSCSSSFFSAQYSWPAGLDALALQQLSRPRLAITAG